VWNSPDNSDDVNQAFFEIAWWVRKETAMSSAVQTTLPDTILRHLRNADGPVMLQDLSREMEQLGYDVDDTADAVVTLEQNGMIIPGGGAWLKLAA